MQLGEKSKQRIKEEAEVQQQTISLLDNVQKWAHQSVFDHWSMTSIPG